MKKIIFYIIGLAGTISQAFADITGPSTDMGLPTFSTNGEVLGFIPNQKNNPHGFLTKGIAEAIKYIGLLAVISLTIGGIMYLTSMGDEGKFKKAKNIVMYSIIGVFVALSAYSLVEIVNNFNLQ